MARYKARLTRDSAGDWIAAAVELPNCWSRGRDRDEALAKLRDEIRYRIEYCPCTGVDDDFVQVEVVETVGPPAGARAAPRGRGDTAPHEGAPRADTPADVATWRGVAGCPSGPWTGARAALRGDGDGDGAAHDVAPRADMSPRRPSRWRD